MMDHIECVHDNWAHKRIPQAVFAEIPVSVDRWGAEYALGKNVTSPGVLIKKVYLQIAATRCLHHPTSVDDARRWRSNSISVSFSAKEVRTIGNKLEMSRMRGHNNNAPTTVIVALPSSSYWITSRNHREGIFSESSSVASEKSQVILPTAAY